MPNSKKEKYCPFMGKECVKQRCAIYNEILDRCDIGVLGYNLYTVKEMIGRALDELGFSMESKNPAFSSRGKSGSRMPAKGRKKPRTPWDEFFQDEHE